MTKKGNRLQYEKSPYLLQHKDNPVDWYPWGPEAFEKARKEDKPIFLSIGYSTCHWCHVMEHESFEDPEVARLMNDAFVSIKVDREERPDIDNIYMAVCQMLTKSGGWPLTIIMTPDKKPFFAGTYFPKTSRFGRPGMMELIPQIKEVWETKRAEVNDSADKISTALTQMVSTPTGGASLGKPALTRAFGQLAERFDQTHGGFGNAPKFPTPHNMLFLLRHWKRTGDAEALAMVEKTLGQMRLGGVYDHVGFGFHRYSTDPRWFLPHFEKMLYDQAMLAMAYTEAYQATGKTEYRDTAEEIFTYVLRDMTSPEGAFYSAEDADSEGEEGKFYLWSDAELRKILGKDAPVFIKAYQVTTGGNYQEEASGEQKGSNILHLTSPLSAIARELGMDEAELRGTVERSRKKLFDVREKRVHPYKDDKVLTDWNGLMVSALARASQAFSEPRYLAAAERAMGFVLNTMKDPKGRLLHRFREGDAGITAKVEDYAFTIMALIDLFEASLDIDYLKTALELNQHFLAHFWDPEAGGFFFTADYAEDLIVRPKEVYDGAIPSGNSAAMLNLLRLEKITGDPELGERAEGIGRAFSQSVNRYPAGFTLLMTALDFAVGPTNEVVIVGTKGTPDTEAMLSALRGEYIPSKVVIFKPAGDDDGGLSKIAAFTKTQRQLGGKATAYVCRNFECKLPTTDPEKMVELLEGKE